jgi:hypothetical protein
VDAGLVEQARANVAGNDAPIEVVQSRFFDRVFERDGDREPAEGDSAGSPEEGFDCVTFNAPYVPRREVGADGGDDRYAVQSDGGERGTDVIDGFLRAFEAEPRVPLAYLGVNTLMVPRRMVEACIADRAGLRLQEIAGSGLLPVDVYVVGRAGDS